VLVVEAMNQTVVAPGRAASGSGHGMHARFSLLGKEEARFDRFFAVFLPICISKQMIRPCFLVVDKQYPGSISARKLVIETAMLNVITAYSAEEAVQVLNRFPKVDGAVIDTEVSGMSCAELIRQLRAIRPDLPVITVSPTGYEPCGGEQFHVSSYDPQDLLEQLQAVCPKEIRRKAEESNSSPE
jgi:CheY-like chemotaxis protein